MEITENERYFLDKAYENALKYIHNIRYYSGIEVEQMATTGAAGCAGFIGGGVGVIVVVAIAIVAAFLLKRRSEEK